MADLSPLTAFAAPLGSVSGETGPFRLPQAAPGAIFVVSVVTAVSGSSPQLNVYLDVAENGNWTQVCALAQQSAAGVASGYATLPPDASPVFRLRWMVGGTNPVFLGKAFAVVA